MFERTLLLENVNADALPSWPVTWGVALPAGALTSDNADLVLGSQDGTITPAQINALSRHPDGSIHRMIVTAELALSPDSSLQFTLRERIQSDAPTSPAPADSEKNAPIRGGVGALTLENGEILWVSNHGRYALQFVASRCIDDAGAAPAELLARYTSLRTSASATIQGAAQFTGSLFHGHDALLDLIVTVRMPRSTPVMFFSVALKCRERAVTLDHFELRIKKIDAEAVPWSRAFYEVRQFPAQLESALPLSVRSTKLALTMSQPDRTREQTSRLLNFNETWLSAENAGEKFVVGLRNFFEYDPYGFTVDREHIAVEFWPKWHGKPWKLAPGRGKTHELMFASLPVDSPFLPRAIGYAFGKPPLPRMPLAQLAEAGVMSELLEYDPEQYPRIETILYDLAFNRNRGYGKMNYGDDYSELYTQQGRGKGAIVWNNLEGDHPYHMFCQAMRTGRYFFYKDYRDSLLHWSDVDFCDHHPDRGLRGALTQHSADHVTGSASPCHNWAESFKEWYFSTGEARPREVLGMMADWLVFKSEQHFFKVEPEPYVRGCGWGLIQMAAIQEVLARADIEAIIRPLCKNLLDYCIKNRGLVMTMPTGGVWTPRDNAFHTVTVILGAYNCWKLYREPMMRDLALTATEALMDRRTSTPEGIAVYISGPEQDFPMQQAACFAMAGLAIAYRLTGETRYVKRGMRNLEYCLDRGMIVDHMRIPGHIEQHGDDIVLRPALEMPNSQLLGYQLRGLLLFMRAAHDAGMLKQVDYKF